jgi:metal-responsive CopG/Arc/MetJ family transcriptional regulator
MTKDTMANECADPMQNFTVELPCRIVERIERYAKEKGTSMPSVLIEALDSFLSKPE